MVTGLLTTATIIIWPSFLTSLILLALGATTLVLLHAIIIGKACRQALAAVNRDAAFLEPGNGLSSRDLEKLLCFEISSPSETDCCAVCLENFRQGERCRRLPACAHSFHAGCVDRWLVRSPLCPICRSNAGQRGALLSDS